MASAQANGVRLNLSMEEARDLYRNLVNNSIGDDENTIAEITNVLEELVID